MPPLPNGRHELFACELAAGRTADEAYELAGYKPNRGNAARLKANDDIQARVAELKAASALRTGVTVDLLTQELIAILRRANGGASAGHLNAARQSVMDIAKLNGLVVDRQVNASVTLEELLGELDAEDELDGQGEDSPPEA